MRRAVAGARPRRLFHARRFKLAGLFDLKDFINREAANLGVTIYSGDLMDKDFIATLRRLKKQAAEAEKILLFHLLSVAELEAKSSRKAA